ncbi:MAG: threonine aldolase, partial [Pseudomonadales bacterium]
LAKGRLLGIQFQTLFSDNLFFKLSENANKTAQRLSNAFIDAGHEMAAATESNQIFPILPNVLIRQLKEQFDFYVWEPLDNDRSVVRFVTSWATDDTQVDALTEALLK